MQSHDEQIEAAVSKFKQLVLARYPEEVWKDAVRERLTTDVRVYIRARVQNGDVADDSDLDFFIESFFQTHEGQLQRLSKKAEKRAEDKSEAKQRHGSLQSILTYTMLLPKAIRLRQKILGSRIPLSYQEAVTWLRAENDSAEGEPTAWLSFGFTVKIPDKGGSKASHIRAYIDLVESEAVTPEACGEFVTKLLKMHMQSEYELSDSDRNRYMFPDFRTTFKHLRLLGEKESVRLGHGQLISLADAAEQLQPEAGSLDAACWLILTGLWRLPPMRMLGVDHEGYRPLGRIASRAAMPQHPLKLEVAEWATAPEALADYFRKIRQHHELPSRTRQPTFESEVIALCAIEVSNIHNIYAGDVGYYPHVLGLFEERAFEYGVDPFVDFAPGSTKTQRLDAIRKVLERIEKLHQEYYANTLSYGVRIRKRETPPERSLFKRPKR